MTKLRNQLLGGTVLALTVCLPANAKDDAATAASDRDIASSQKSAQFDELFANPTAEYRPKYRWWIPRGAAVPGELQREMREMLEAGAGGAEVSPFFNPGGAQQTGQGLAATGWESENWKSVSRSLFSEASRLNFILDDTMSGLGSDTISVPQRAAWQHPSVSKRMIAAYRVLKASENFDGALPAPQQTPLVSALCAPSEAGDTSILPVLTGWLAPGAEIVVGSGDLAERATVKMAHGGTWGCGKSLTALAPGSTTLFVSNLIGGGGMDPSGRSYTQFNVGQKIRVGQGKTSETVVVESLGEAAASDVMRLQGPLSTGATELKVEFTQNFFGTLPVGPDHFILVGENGQSEKALVTSVRQSGNELVLQLASPLTRGHEAQTIRDVGTGIRISPIKQLHLPGEDVGVVPHDGDRQGVELDTPLKNPHGLQELVGSTPTKTLTAALAYRCVSDCAADLKELDPKTVTDLTADARDGKIDGLKWRTGGDWVVFAQYQVADEPFQKGSFSPYGFDFPIDHLSAEGAASVISYWSQKLRSEGRVRAPGEASAKPALFEDSLEMPFNQKWSEDFIAEWRSRRGYDPTPFLPALYHTDQQGRVPSGFFAQFLPKDRFDFSGVDTGRVGEDYRRTWSDLFRDRFVAPIASWAKSQGVSTRFQLYGSFPIDTSWASSVVDIPEGEALGFDDDINTYAIVASGAHMSGQSTVSNECCAAKDRAYKDSLTGPSGTLTKVFQAFAGGVNQQIWHGYSYRAVQTSKWPGYHAWSPEGGTATFSEAFGKRLPAWQTGSVRQVNDAIARASLVLRQGKPTIDLAVYHHVFGRGLFQGPEAPTIRPTGPIARRGFSLGFISPEYLRASATQIWKNGRLFPENARYKALVFDNQNTLTVEAVDTIVSLAGRGAKIVFIGKVPTRAYGLDPTGSNDAKVALAMSRLRGMAAKSRNVFFVQDENEAVAKLSTAGIVPAAAALAPNLVTTVKRRDAKYSYYYLYNGGDTPFEGTWSFEATGSPLLLDIWTGTISPIANYTNGQKTISLPLSIAPKDVALVAFALKPSLTDHVVEVVGGEIVAKSPRIFARGTNGPVRYQLAKGGHGTISFDDGLAPFKLDKWQLTLAEWRSADKSVGLDAWRTKITRGIDDLALTPDKQGLLPVWKDAGAAFATGIGTYKTTFELSGSGWANDRGAFLDLGKVTGTPAISVNGKAVKFDLQNPSRIDIGAYLRAGTNQLEVTVASNLTNSIDGYSEPYGLVGPILVRPYLDKEIPTAGAR